MKKYNAYQVAACFILLVVLVSCVYDKKEISLSEEEFRDQLNQRIPVWMERYDVPGISIALITNGEIRWTDAFGYASLEKQTLMTSETVCRVESISKSVTARGVMKLAEMGKIGLDDPVIRYLNSWEFPDTEIDVERVTIRHLLSHSSGLPLGTIGLEYAPEEVKPTLKESLTQEVRLDRDPGSQFNYSNVGFHLLELLIEEVIGKDFSVFMESEILIPLEMEHSSFEWSEDFNTQVPNGHNLKGEPIPVYVYSEKGAGGLFASAVDIARFVTYGMVNEFYLHENILSEQGIRELYSPVIKVTNIYGLVSEHYGLGHFIETLPNGQLAVFSGGQGNGWMTHFHLVPESGDGIVILTNSSRSWPLISHILIDWVDWNGFGLVGMGLISKAITVLWIFTGLVLAFCSWMFLQIILDIRNGKREMSFKFQQYTQEQYVKLVSVMILISVLIWSLNQEYLIITAVFPGVSKWLILAFWVVAVVMLLLVLFPKTIVDGNSDYIHKSKRNFAVKNIEL